MRVITAPEHYYNMGEDITCFLAGGITNCPDWQKQVVEELQKQEQAGIDLSHLVIFNPRRENFPIWKPNIAVEQITWEFDYLNQADIFSMYFAATEESDQPICFYELGRNLVTMQQRYPTDYKRRLVISHAPEFKRMADVYIQTALATRSLVNVHENITPEDHANWIIRAYLGLVD